MEEEKELQEGETMLREQFECDDAGHFFRTREIHGLQIREMPWDLEGDVGTGGVVWSAANVLISHLPTADEIAGKRVLELGSGCGLPGLVLAARGADVTLSDYTSILVENLKHNSTKNDIPARCILLDWNAIEDADPCGPFDLVIGSDLVYGDRGPLLASVVSTLKAPCLLVFDTSRDGVAEFEAALTVPKAQSFVNVEDESFVIFRLG